MEAVVLTLLHLAVTAAKLCRPGGVRAVIAENLLLKQQLIVLRRPRKRAPNLTTVDRLLCGFGSLFLGPGRLRKVAIGVRPSTLLAFHRALVHRKYRRLFSSSHRPRTPGPKGPRDALIRAIVELKSRNPRFGCPLAWHASSRGRSASTSTRTSSLACWRNTIDPPPGGSGLSWLSFIGHATDSLWSVDLFRCESIVLQSYWVLVVMDQCTRRLVGFGVHRGSVDAPGLCRMFNAATHGQGAPRHLSTDHDPLFEAHRWQANLRLLEIDEIKTVPHVPLSHPLCRAPDRHDTARISGPGVLLEWAGSGAETRRLPGLLQRGTEPRVLGRPHAVRRGERTPGSPCGPQQHTVGISLPGPGSVASGGLIRNSRPTGRAAAVEAALELAFV